MTVVRAFSIALFTIFWLFCCKFQLAAQDFQPIQLNVEDGLPSNTVYRVVQDVDGYIWMATDAGVARYDGQHFETFTVEDGLTNNDILNIQQDSQGRIWFLALAGGFCYYYDGKIHNPQNDSTLSGGPHSSFLSYFFEDSQGRLWFFSRREGIYCWKDKVLKRFDVPGPNHAAGAGAIWEEPGGKIMARTRKRIYQIHPKTRLELDSLPPFPLVSGGFVLDNQAGILVGDYSENIWLENSQGSQLFISKDFESRAFAIRQLPDSVIWVSTYAGGITRFQMVAGGDSCIRTGLFFPDHIVTSVIQDNEGNHWFSTERAGVFLVRPHKIKNYDTFSGLESSGILNIHKDQTNSYWICSSAERLLKGKSIAGPFQIAPYRAGFEFNGVFDLRGGGIGCFGSGMATIPTGDPSAIKLIKKRLASEIIPFIYGKDGAVLFSEMGAVKEIISAADGYYWGASNSYLFKFFSDRPAEESIQNLVKGRFSDLVEAPDGTLWVGKSNGLFAYQNGKLVSHQDAHPAFSGAPQDLVFSPRTGLWVATNGQGLVNYDPKTGKTHQITKDDYLAGNHCLDLELVDDQTLWVGTKSGLSRLDLSESLQGATRRIFTLTREDGLLANEVSSIFIEGDTIMACTPSGISVFHKDEAKRTLPPPPLYLNTVHFGDSLFDPNGTASLPYSNSSPRFSFTALSYGSLGKINYQYWLSPIESVPHSTSTQEASYNQLPPGEYTFNLEAKAKDGTPSQNRIQFQFTIRKAWWQTWLFRISGMIFLGLLIWGAMRFRLRNRRQRLELERKFLESERKALRAQMNPHFVFNSLNSIQNFLAKNDRKAAYTYLARFGKLIRNILENSDKTYITVEEELTVLKLYLQMESLRADHRFDYNLSLDSKIQANKVMIPPMLLQPYVENAIWHGVMPLKEKGQINITLEARQTGLWCCIEDNGVGRTAAGKKKTDGRQRSFGTRITEERLALLNDNQRKKIHVETTDLHGPEGQALGTRVQLFVPFIRND